MNYEQYYQQLEKPFFAPPSSIFGIVWPGLYVLIFLSFGWVFYQVVIKKRWSLKLLIPFVLNGITNALYTPLFFNWQHPLLATIDILIVLTTIVWIMAVMWRRAKWVSIVQLPYLFWVSFATALQIAILLKNWNVG